MTRSLIVSTHSRLKAAGSNGKRQRGHQDCFNTQPPEGGWADAGWGYDLREVSTHSRLKAAGCNLLVIVGTVIVSTHSRLKAAGSLNHVWRIAWKFQHTAA